MTVSKAVQVANDPSEKPSEEPEAPVIFAFKVSVSVVASPRVVLPFIAPLPEMFKVEADTEPVTITFCEKRPDPTTSSATVGEVVPIPSLPEKEAVPEVKI